MRITAACFEREQVSERVSGVMLTVGVLAGERLEWQYAW